MAKGKKRLRLKKHMAAFVAQNEQGQETVIDLPLTAIRPNPYQPRRSFDQVALAELAQSIQANGVFQPVIVRQPNPQVARYELIAGERRFRASEIAHQTTIPAILRPLDDAAMMEVAVLENLQREDLTPLEEAQAYQMLLDKLHLTQAEVAARLGKSRPYIANYLRLLGLPAAVKELLEARQLSMGQARTLLGLKDKAAVVALAKRAVKEGLTVRQLEEMVARQNEPAAKPQAPRPAAPVDPYLKEAADQLQRRFGTKVAFSGTQPHRGKIEIPYQSADELNRLLALLGVSFD